MTSMCCQATKTIKLSFSRTLSFSLVNYGYGYELRKLSQHQLNSIRKEDSVKSILSAPEPDDANHTMTQLTALIAKVADIEMALTSPDSAINHQVRALQDRVNKQQEVITRHQRYQEDTDRKAKECNVCMYT